MVKRALINFAMIQTVIFASSVNIGAHLPTSDGMLTAIAFVWLVTSMITLLPAIAVSVTFAYFQEAK